MSKKELKVRIDLKEESDFVSKYNNETLHPKLKEYIINELVGFSTESNLTLIIKTNYNLTDEQKNQYIKILKEEFKEDIDEDKYISKRIKAKEIYSTILGALFILISYFININILGVLREIILIIGWVLIWEAAYTIIFTNNKRKNNIKRLKQISKCKIEFK